MDRRYPEHSDLVLDVSQGLVEFERARAVTEMLDEHAADLRDAAVDLHPVHELGVADPVTSVGRPAQHPPGPEGVDEGGPSGPGKSDPAETFGAAEQVGAAEDQGQPSRFY